MTGKQQAVLWLGLTLVGLRFFTNGQFKAIWQTVTTGTQSIPNTGSGGGGSGQGGGGKATTQQASTTV